ncbi:unnamed protein product [Gongylonema pulchrum]|uniref:Aa_trans domain-containing protein n=1 Tax=Gongylonema pulchrum TaxID=637853 RepID=A0A183E647_9BILA|nr:unnamed protein product [Gongylonema pulchrum]
MQKPFWAPTNPKIYGMMDILTMLPLGYASYRVFKYGGGFEFNGITAMALGLYGASLVFAFHSMPFIKATSGCTVGPELLPDRMYITPLPRLACQFFLVQNPYTVLSMFNVRQCSTQSFGVSRGVSRFRESLPDGMQHNMVRRLDYMVCKYSPAPRQHQLVHTSSGRLKKLPDYLYSLICEMVILTVGMICSSST